MERFKTIIIIVLSGLLFLLCCNSQVQNNETEILSESSWSYKRSGSLVDELYNELVKESAELKSLEEALEEHRPKTMKLMEKFNSYDGKSSSYYNAAKSEANSIIDTVLGARINALVKANADQYGQYTNELTALINTISGNGTRISDNHTVLKVVATLPVINRYQRENKPDKKEYLQHIQEQEKLIKRIQQNTPKFP